MIKKIKEFIAKKTTEKKQKAELVRLQKYYDMLRAGASFIQAIRNDMKQQGEKMNRSQRRRFEKTLVKGEFTEELVNHYKDNLNRILKDIDKKLNVPK